MQRGERRAESCSVIQAVIGDGELGLMPVFPSVLLPRVGLQRRYRKKCTVVESFSSLLSRGSLEQLSEGERGGCCSPFPLEGGTRPVLQPNTAVWKMRGESFSLLRAAHPLTHLSSGHIWYQHRCV